MARHSDGRRSSQETDIRTSEEAGALPGHVRGLLERAQLLLSVGAIALWGALMVPSFRAARWLLGTCPLTQARTDRPFGMSRRLLGQEREIARRCAQSLHDGLDHPAGAKKG